jgi:hypothetical protein
MNIDLNSSTYFLLDDRKRVLIDLANYEGITLGLASTWLSVCQLAESASLNEEYRARELRPGDILTIFVDTSTLSVVLCGIGDRAGRPVLMLGASSPTDWPTLRRFFIDHGGKGEIRLINSTGHYSAA